MLLWRAIREDEMGADYPRRIAVDPATDRARLGPFTRMEFDRPYGDMGCRWFAAP